MGAYLHLRGLAELDEVSDSSSSRGSSDSFNPGCSSSVAVSLDFPGSLALSATAHEMDDCSNFWAGRLDDVFEDLLVKSRFQNAPSAEVRVIGIGKGDAQKRGLDRQEQGECSSGQSRFDQEAFVENRTVDVHRLDIGGPSSSFEQNSSRGKCRNEGERDYFFTDGPNPGGSGGLDSTHSSSRGCDEVLEEDQMERLPDHLLIELLVRVPTRDWPAAACVKKRWAQLFRGDGLWHSALTKKWPGASSTKRWPGPIARGSSKRRYTALYVSDSLFARDKVEGVNEVAGHVYLFLKEQLESPTPPVSYGLLHGTIIGEQTAPVVLESSAI